MVYHLTFDTGYTMLPAGESNISSSVGQSNHRSSSCFVILCRWLRCFTRRVKQKQTIRKFTLLRLLSVRFMLWNKFDLITLTSTPEILSNYQGSVIVPKNVQKCSLLMRHLLCPRVNKFWACYHCLNMTWLINLKNSYSYCLQESYANAMTPGVIR